MKREMIRIIINQMAALMMAVAASVSASGQQPVPRRDAGEYIKLLEGERRVEGLQVKRVIETLKVKAGQAVADIGAGSGLFTRPIARETGPTGAVYAVDIDPALLKHVEATSKEAGLTNVHTILGGADDPKLPAPVDLIMIIDTLHHIDQREVYLKNLRRHLKPGGRLAIIDFSENWPPGHESMKYTLAQLEAWSAAGGYERVEKHDFLENNFFVIYRVK